MESSSRVIMGCLIVSALTCLLAAPNVVALKFSAVAVETTSTTQTDAFPTNTSVSEESAGDGCGVWVGTIFEGTSCTGANFNRCVGSSVGCVSIPAHSNIPYAQSVQTGVATCLACFYTDTACASGRCIYIPQNQYPQCWSLGIRAQSYKITC